MVALRKAQEEAFERQRREQVELAEDAELQRLREARERALEQKAGQMKQLDELRASILADRAANKEAVRFAPHFWACQFPRPGLFLMYGKPDVESSAQCRSNFRAALCLCACIQSFCFRSCQLRWTECYADMWPFCQWPVIGLHIAKVECIDTQLVCW